MNSCTFFKMQSKGLQSSRDVVFTSNLHKTDLMTLLDVLTTPMNLQLTRY